jgi:hypothetical protein
MKLLLLPRGLLEDEYPVNFLAANGPGVPARTQARNCVQHQARTDLLPYEMLVKSGYC